MVCSEGGVKAGFAFALLSELLFLFPLFILTALFTINKIPRKAITFYLFAAAPALLLFSIISIATTAECYEGSLSDTIAHGYFGLTTGIRSMLLSFFLIALILVNKFAFDGDWFLGENSLVSKTQAANQTSPPQYGTSPAMQYNAQAMAYANPPSMPQQPTTQQQAVPMGPGLNTQPLHSNPPTQTQ